MGSTSAEGGKVVISTYSGFRKAVSMFKMVRDDELEFLNFRAFSPMMYGRFIENLKKKLTEV